MSTRAEVLSGLAVNAALGIADRLRATAAQVEQHARVAPALEDLYPDHAEMAADVCRDISSMMGNLRLDALVLRAAEADRAARPLDPAAP